MNLHRLMLLTVLLLAPGRLASSPAAAPPDSKAGRGTLCIAPFHVPKPEPGPPAASEPIMSQTTWPPAYTSRFSFHIDHRPAVTVANDEMAFITDLPTDRRVRVRVQLDGRPYETFSLDLGRASDHRICLWLYPGYWHWIDNGWEPSLGCKCGEKPEMEIERIVRERLQAAARGDKAAWRRHIANDCVWTGPGLANGTTADAELEITANPSLPPQAAEIRDLEVRLFGDTAVATYLYIAGPVAGSGPAKRFRRTDVYLRRDGDWRMITAVEVFAPPRPVAQVDPKVYDSYAGRFELDSNHVVRARHRITVPVLAPAPKGATA